MDNIVSTVAVSPLAVAVLLLATGPASGADTDVKKSAETPLKITREPLGLGQISSLQYGQFIEYLCNLVPSMWAEKLYDGSFEGLSPYKVVFLKQTDFREQPWYPSGAVNRAEYTLDRSDPVSGEVAQKIFVKEGAPCTVGLSQNGIALERGKTCMFSCYLRQQGLAGAVQVRLHHEGKIYASCEFRPTDVWKKYRARLEPSATEPSATLTIGFRGPGTLWLDNASLMPDANVGGWRPDVVEAVRALKPGIIRFGGSALDDPKLGEFEWRDTIGDPDHRKPFRAGAACSRPGRAWRRLSSSAAWSARSRFSVSASRSTSRKMPPMRYSTSMALPIRRWASCGPATAMQSRTTSSTGK